MRPASICAALVLLLCFSLSASAQLPVRPEEVVNLSLVPAQAEIKAGQTVTLTLVAAIMRGYHVNSSKPLEDYLIPTKVELAETDGFALEKVDYPEGELKSFSFSRDEKLSVYEGVLRLPLRLHAKKETPAGTYTLKLVFHYQACNDKLCLRPIKKEISLTLRLQ